MRIKNQTQLCCQASGATVLAGTAARTIRSQPADSGIELYGLTPLSHYDHIFFPEVSHAKISRCRIGRSAPSAQLPGFPGLLSRRPSSIRSDLG